MCVCVFFFIVLLRKTIHTVTRYQYARYLLYYIRSVWRIYYVVILDFLVVFPLVSPCDAKFYASVRFRAKSIILQRFSKDTHVVYNIKIGPFPIREPSVRPQQNDLVGIVFLYFLPSSTRVGKNSFVSTNLIRTLPSP